MTFPRLFLLAALLLPGIVRAEMAGAEDLYREYQDRIFQIQVLDVASNKKAIIGTGFRVSAGGLLATNYHVVAEYIHDPQNYRVEYLAYDGTTGPVTVRDIDVIHDLAIVQAKLDGEVFLPLAQGKLSKGARIYAIGNPHDLGMSIVDGTYNGLLEKTQYEKILFSGSLNPGMSGGPTLNARGEVIGVNVSTAGNNLSFLVPVRYLQVLLDDANRQGEASIDLQKRIGEQLQANQRHIMQGILDAKWKTMNLGNTVVPAELNRYFECWGQTDSKPDSLYTHTYSACASPDDIFVSDHFSTGSVDFRYALLNSEKLNRFQFQNLYTDKFSEAGSTNKADEEDVENYRCNTRFVEIESQTWKTAVCLREYKKYTGLYDVSLNMAHIGDNTRGLLVNMNAAGVDRENAMALVRKFMEGVTWQN
jgi:hypothetical protein